MQLFIVYFTDGSIISGLILGLRTANERRRYKRWTQT